MDRVLRLPGHEGKHLVARLEHGVSAGYDQSAASDHGDDRGVPRDLESSDADADSRRFVRQGDLDELGMPALQAQQADKGADRDRLLDQCGHHERHAHGHIDSPGVVEEPLVLGVVHPCDDAGNGELLLRQTTR